MTPCPPAKRGAAGFTVVEALVVVALMAIALSGITAASVMSVKADTKSHRESVATTLAQAKLDQMRTLLRDDSGWSSGTHTEPHVGESGVVQSGAPYSRQWVVELGYNGHSNLSRVTATVSWNDGEVRAVTLSSLYW